MSALYNEGRALDLDSVASTVLIAVMVLTSPGCISATKTARLSPSEPTSERETLAKQRVEKHDCLEFTVWLYPGVGQFCQDKEAEAAALGILTAAEAAGSLALTSRLVSDTGAFEPTRPAIALTTAVQNLYTYSVASYYIEEDLAEERPYAPQDSLGDLVKAPFNLEVLSRPEVFGGIIGLGGAAIAVTLLGADDVSLTDPRYYGLDLPRPVAYGAAAATGTALFSHVAVGEEALFRGVVQSSLARQHNEWVGWMWSSLLFGAVHMMNLAAMAPEEQLDYLRTGLPVITLTGSYLGLAYKWSDYTLTTPVAIHFWYNLLISGASFLTSDGDSPIGMGVKIPF